MRGGEVWGGFFCVNRGQPRTIDMVGSLSKYFPRFAEYKINKYCSAPQPVINLFQQTINDHDN